MILKEMIQRTQCWPTDDGHGVPSHSDTAISWSVKIAQDTPSIRYGCRSEESSKESSQHYSLEVLGCSSAETEGDGNEHRNHYRNTSAIYFAQRCPQ